MKAWSLPWLVCLAACSATKPEVDLDAIYSEPAQRLGASRVPAIVIPGILGSKLVDAKTEQRVWGSFTFGAADIDTPEGAREFALPMRIGATLAELRDDVFASEALDYFVTDIGPFRAIRTGAYVDILSALAAGGFRDQTLRRSGAVDYGEGHSTCFQVAYDWRRDVSENASALHERIVEAQVRAREAAGLEIDAPLKVDVVAHSMGGLVLRYYLRYGATPLPEDGSLPTLDWSGARNVARAFLVGTPSAGSAESLVELVEGLDLHPFFPNFRPAVLGTLPAIYQLLPRERHGAVRNARGETVDPLALETWERYGWGLLDERDGRSLKWLLPEIEDEEERRKIAREHLAKCLTRARQLFAALDVSASPPEGTELYLFAGDGAMTASEVTVSDDGSVEVSAKAPGDGTVTRGSALMDERMGGPWSAGLRSPIAWTRVQFASDDHLELTRSATFIDNLLYLMLEAPR